MSISRQKGFTLVEVVVVVANVALMAAILVPIVGRQIDDAKVARAKNETQLIAAAILRFYNDVGLWPAASDVMGFGTFVNNTANRLVSGTAVETIGMATTGTDYGYTQDDNDNWYDNHTAGPIAIGDVQLFSDSLNTNAQGYPSSGELSWKGPYLPPVLDDPWGHHYVCNIKQAYSGTDKVCVVMSAGPNGYFDTAVNPSASVGEPSGDDIWAVVTLRP